MQKKWKTRTFIRMLQIEDLFEIFKNCDYKLFNKIVINLTINNDDA